ncbi:MAG: 1-(5-phosphoribosyl)-5-[(5-phosphoribosylamino)methylideneamino]imidazole-4-carboxamide isomerase [Pirellulales bacterium]|nr:1-(5-phosphoribosyl)-5-[(5-phosphoribosylamino)methylideneamino]imidazole-4-carboxamide isomerase [Pirellulales bacterium]
MQIWPAIDLRGGRCVRLQQGDYNRETVFGEDPAAVARQFVDAGAEFLHIVDLDGARAGCPENLDSIRAIRAAVDVPCQLGGGIRGDETVGQLLDLGIDRLVIGTRGLEDPHWLRHAARKHPDRLVLGVDARDGMVATHGWLSTSGTAAIELIDMFADEPLAAVVYTDIAQDGMLAGPNFAALTKLVGAVRLPIIASGGVTTVDDVRRLAALPVAGAIIGRALYEGRITLPEALAAAGCTKGSPIG